MEDPPSPRTHTDAVFPASPIDIASSDVTADDDALPMLSPQEQDSFHAFDPSALPDRIFSDSDSDSDDDDELPHWSSSEDEDEDEDLVPVPMSPSEVENLTPEERAAMKCFRAAQEMLTTERSYVAGLEVLQDLYLPKLAKLSKAAFPPEKSKAIFMNADALLKLHRMILEKLEEVFADGRANGCSDGSGVGSTMLEFLPYMKPYYEEYTKKFDSAMKTLEEQTKNSKFASVLADCAKDPKAASLSLGAYLLQPVQRIPRYKMLLAEYLKKRVPEHEDYIPAQDALAKITEIAKQVNLSITKDEQLQKANELQEHFGLKFQVLKPGRELLRDATLAKVCRKSVQTRRVYLFSDLLLYCKDTYEGPTGVPLDGMQAQIIDYSGAGVRHCILIKQKKKAFVLACKSSKEKTQWLETITSAIEDNSSKKMSFRKASSRKMSLVPDGALLYGTKAPVWIPDKAVSMCQLCATPFNVTRRRHHCRLCGKVVCGPCSSYKLKIAYEDMKLGRVCVGCYAEWGFTGDLEGDAAKTAEKAEVDKKFEVAKQKLASVTGKQALHVAAHGMLSQDNQTIMSGYMHQKQAGMFQSWKRSWFVLKRDFCLYQYDSLAMCDCGLLSLALV